MEVAHLKITTTPPKSESLALNFKYNLVSIYDISL